MEWSSIPRYRDFDLHMGATSLYMHATGTQAFEAPVDGITTRSATSLDRPLFGVTAPAPPASERFRRSTTRLHRLPAYDHHRNCATSSRTHQDILQTVKEHVELPTVYSRPRKRACVRVGGTVTPTTSGLRNRPKPALTAEITAEEIWRAGTPRSRGRLVHGQTTSARLHRPELTLNLCRLHVPSRSSLNSTIPP